MRRRARLRLARLALRAARAGALASPGIVWAHVDERCAGFFALGLAQQTGQPALC